MAINSCDICGCIPAYVKDDFFYQTALNLLCDLVANTAADATSNVNVAQYGGVATTLGQKLMAASIPVTFASDQSALPVTLAAGATSIGKAEDTGHVSGDVGVMMLAVRNDADGVFTGTDLDYSPISVTARGHQRVEILADNISPWILEDAASASGQIGLVTPIIRRDVPVAETSADGDYTIATANSFGMAYTDGVYRSTGTHTQPTVTTATSFTLVAANTSRRYLLIQNNSAANILINVNNGTLTGIVPTSTNLGIVLIPGASYASPPNFAPTGIIKVYQASGGSINTVSVFEG